MAEILLRKKLHFAETTKPAAWSDDKFARRPRQGDIVEVYPNGHFEIWATGQTGLGWDRVAFALVKLVNVDPSTWTRLRGWTDETHTVPYKNRYGMGTNIWANIPWTKTTRTVGGVEVEEWYYQRNTGGAVVAFTDRMA